MEELSGAAEESEIKQVADGVIMKPSEKQDKPTTIKP